MCICVCVYVCVCMPHRAAEAVAAAQAWMQGARPSPSNEARQLMPNRAAMLANLVGGPGIFVDPLKKPPPRPVGCEGRLLRSPVLSSAPVDNLAYFHRTKLFKMANLTQVTHLARRAHVPLAYQRARTCAVVGSSSKLLDAAEGSLIDASELVFRMNHAPVLPELRAYIGSRTDVHVDPIQLHGAFGSINASDATSSQIYTCTSNHDYPGCLTFSPKLSSVSGPHDRRTCKHCGARVLAGVSERWDRTFPGAPPPRCVLPRARRRRCCRGSLGANGIVCLTASRPCPWRLPRACDRSFGARCRPPRGL